MKKNISILTIAAVFLCSAVFTSCGAADAVKEVVESSYNQWYQYKGETNFSIPLGTEDDDTEPVKSLENADIFVYFTTEDGLTVAVQTTSEQDVSLFNNLITKTETVYIGGTKQYDKGKFGAGKWTAMLATGKFEKCDEPVIVSGNGNCLVLTGENKSDVQIQWKKFFANYFLKDYLD